MDDLFKSGNYDENLNSLIQVIKLKDIKQIDEQYDKTVRDLSQALRAFTSKAEDVSKFVICTDLNNYVEPVDKKLLGLFGVLKRIWPGKKDTPVKEDNMRSFAQDKLQSFTIKKAAEYINILRKIKLVKEGLDIALKEGRGTILKEISDSRRSKKEEHRPHGVNLESVMTSKQKKEEQLKKKESTGSRMKKIKRPALALPTTAPNELKPEPQKEVATTGKKKVRFKSKLETISFYDSGYRGLSDEESENKKISNYQEEESVCPIVPKEHVEARRASKQQQSKPPKPKSADQQVSTKPRIVGVTLKKLAESKPTVPLKSESQGSGQSAQEAARAAQEVEVFAVKKEVNSKKDGRVKSVIGGIEQNQAAESKATPAAQIDIGADIGVEKNLPQAAFQSHLPQAGNERSEMNLITVKSDPKPLVSKKPPLTHVSVKEMVARFESHGKK